MSMIDIHGGYSLEIYGTQYDLIRFFNAAGRKIGNDPIRNGDSLNALLPGLNGKDVVVHSPVDGYSIVAVRHGNLRDLAYGYAVKNDKVLRSQRWGDFSPGHKPGGLIITFSNSPASRGFDINGMGNGALVFLETELKWACIAQNGAGCVGENTTLSVLPD
jgi:hypothetical protein